MLFVLHSVFTSCHGSATSSYCPMFRYQSSPYVMSILVIISKCVLSSPCACCEIVLGINVTVSCVCK